MRVFITGSSGKIGTKLINFLIKKNYSCILNSRKKIKKYKKITYRIDILNKKFKIPPCDVVIHMAAVTPEKDKKKIFLNRKIDRKIFDEIKKNKTIKKLIFFSTVAVYNNDNNMKKLDEFSKNFSNSNYSKSKLKSEKLFLQNKKIEVYNIRVPALLSNKKDDNFISNLIRKIEKLQKVELYNPNQLFNNFLLIETLNKFINNLLKKRFKSGCIVLGSNRPISLLEITKLISRYFKVNSKINWTLNKKKGFYLNLSNTVKRYKFKPINTKNGLLKYLKLNYIRKDA